MSELSDEASESEQLGASLSVWLGAGQLVRPEELDVPLDLHTAASIGQHDVVVECIRRKEVDLNRKNVGGWTPLMYAAYIGHDRIANVLLDAGVGVNVTTVRRQTPLMLAASCGNEGIAHCLLERGAELEMRDCRGWTALFHCTSTGHQQMVKFLLDNNADASVKDPKSGFTLLMEAAASGHEIIVQNLLQRGVKVNECNAKGETARALAMLYGHTKIASLIDIHSVQMHPKAGLFEDLSSSEDSDSTPRRSHRSRNKPLSIHDGPQAIAFRVGDATKYHERSVAPPGYVTFRAGRGQSEGISNRDVTSPINKLDLESNSSQGTVPFFVLPLVFLYCTSASCATVLGRLVLLARVTSDYLHVLCRDSDQKNSPPNRRKNKNRHGNSESLQACNADLGEFLETIGFSKYVPLLEEQDIDLRIFLTLTENDLKEVGITLFGPKRKMTSAIARWHSNARPPSDALEQAYADQLEAEMQEIAIQLHKKCAEIEQLQGQVSQERELRTVVESCLMEDKMGWRRFQEQVEVTQGAAREAGRALERVRACQAELLVRLKNDSTGGLRSEGRAMQQVESGEKGGSDRRRAFT
ncbi:Ankyrin repeat and SAM domain-containing protein 3 [Acipenser ruthenus]|uniref:Ankyrin repeat and SAM domain-containing protein 3 n=1 Tax=Acipenser ruthenus TaxID=7906 RepID=A0A444UBF2_ACIRT|nr:Ankyrin repeat and SAM domain-containing protein 3 [Acipenser ruthenus]